MVSNSAVSIIVIALLFSVGIMMLSFFQIFSENWFIGLGFIAGSIGVVALTIYFKIQK